jgi:hypothetical protein
MSTTIGTGGGIGNVFFKNMVLHILSKKHNLRASYNICHKFKQLGLDLFIDGTNDYNEKIVLTDETFFNYISESNIHKNVEIHGYFQTREFAEYLKQYFTENNLFEPVKQANPYKDRYNNNNDMYIHVRLTDAAKHNHGITYYDYVISKLEYTTGYISSDDINHPICQYLIQKYKLNIYESKVVDTIQFASTCKHLVLSNGTFSWLIGFFAFYSTIYYPKPDLQHVWFGDIFIYPEWNCVNYITEAISLGWDCSSAITGVEK